jgi:hypothetical protein
MPDYAIFGGCLRSEIQFPELRSVAAESPSWRLRRSAENPTDAGRRLLGMDHVCDEVEVRLFRTGRGFLLDYDDTGTFEVGPDGSIEWCAGPGASEENARLDVIGRVLAVAMHAAGTFCLHGSAVAIEGRGVAFLGPKGQGKSTLACALTLAGARLITDDTAPVDLTSPLRMRPGVHQMRLRPDSAARLGGEASPTDGSGKHVIAELVPDRLAHSAVPLDALYLLRPIAGDPAPAVARTRLAPPVAAVSVMAQAKLASLLGGPEAEVLLSVAATVARRVPVYQLDIGRSWSALDEAVTRLMAWHAGTASAGDVG